MNILKLFKTWISRSRIVETEQTQTDKVKDKSTYEYEHEPVYVDTINCLCIFVWKDSLEV